MKTAADILRILNDVIVVGQRTEDPNLGNQILAVIHARDIEVLEAAVSIARRPDVNTVASVQWLLLDLIAELKKGMADGT